MKVSEAIPGTKVGRLTIVSTFKRPEKNGWLRPWANCVCDCGKRHSVVVDLLGRNTNSCGCLSIVHGLSKTKEYGAIYAMRSRCYSKYNIDYHNYGGRGITVCVRWLDEKLGVLNFIEDMGCAPTSSHSIDRIDVNLGYFKENCRWATLKEQNNNRRNNLYITQYGATKTITQWAEIYDASVERALWRYHKGWKFEDIFNLHPHNPHQSRHLLPLNQTA